LSKDRIEPAGQSDANLSSSLLFLAADVAASSRAVHTLHTPAVAEDEEIR
jgi:hypothetical protein